MTKAGVILDHRPDFADARVVLNDTRIFNRSGRSLEVLLMRIEYEVNGSTKDHSKESRDAYILRLHNEGLILTEIGKLVGLSKSHVQRILKQFPVDGKLIHPNEAQIAKMAELRDEGWTQRDIAVSAQTSRSAGSSRSSRGLAGHPSAARW